MRSANKQVRPINNCVRGSYSTASTALKKAKLLAGERSKPLEMSGCSVSRIYTHNRLRRVFTLVAADQ
jgi:hypothetical protein